jgi:hypothetical protein
MGKGPTFVLGIKEWILVNIHVILFYMDSTCHAISVDMWNAMWFLTVSEIWPCEVRGPPRVF